MQMGNALADTVVDADKGAVGVQALLDGPFHPLNRLKQWSNPGARKVYERFVMPLRHAEAVSRKQWPSVQKDQRKGIFKDQRGLLLTSDDVAEGTRLAEMRSVSRSLLHQ